MPRGPVQRVQDCVHGLMEFRGMETLVIEILRTREVQRLRRIRQLGLAHLVFPGAEHSRLVHCLGAAWVAVRFGRQLIDSTKGFPISVLQPGPSSIRDLAVAALCHDLGHGPLSHAWEREVIGEAYNFDSWASKLGVPEDLRKQLSGAKWHELVTVGLLIWPDGGLHKILERTEQGSSYRIAHLLRGRYYLQYLPRLLASDIDVDRADFIRRDTYQTGVAYGRYDLDWLISACTLGKTDEDQLVVGFDGRKSLRVAEQFLVARQALYDTVYYHKTVHSAEGMVALFLRRVKDIVRDDVKLDIEKTVAPYIRVLAGEAVGQEEIQRLDDFSLFVLIDALTNMPGVDVTVRDLGRRILSRDLFKLVPCTTEEVEEFLGRTGSQDEMFDAIKPFCRGDPRYYLHVDRPRFKLFSSKKGEMGYFIGSDRRAEPIYEHPSLRLLARNGHITRVFTIANAVEAVASLITRKGRPGSAGKA